MSTRRARVAAVVVAALILAAGVAYAVLRDVDYESSAGLLLAPAAGTDPATVSSLLESFQRSGTSGTFVELISSGDTLRRAGVGDEEISVRAVPDARTISVTATGDRGDVQSALTRVIEATQAREGELGDVWELRVLGTPSEPEVSGISTSMLLAAVVLLALLGAAITTVVFGRYRLVPLADLEPAKLGAGGGPAAGGGEGLPQRVPQQIEQVAEPRVHLELESFRFVRASATTVLLQVTGYWRASASRELTAPTLLLHDGRRMHPIAPLGAADGDAPQAGPETPLWRGSYAAPIEIFDRSERIALRAGPGVVIGLPNPVEQALLATPENGDGPSGAGDDEPAREPDPADAR